MRQLGFASTPIPNLYHAQREDTFYEIVDGELVVTRWQGIPLARYNLKDRVPALFLASAVPGPGNRR